MHGYILEQMNKFVAKLLLNMLKMKFSSKILPIVMSHFGKNEFIFNECFPEISLIVL